MILESKEKQAKKIKTMMVIVMCHLPISDFAWDDSLLLPMIFIASIRSIRAGFDDHMQLLTLIDTIYMRKIMTIRLFERSYYT
jgi:hypothetical protein